MNDKSSKNIAKEFTDKVWFLNLSKKETIKEEAQIVKDTTLIYSAREKIPEGILVVSEIEILPFILCKTKECSSTKKIFLKIPEGVEIKTRLNKGNYVDINKKNIALLWNYRMEGGNAGAGLYQKNDDLQY